MSVKRGDERNFVGLIVPEMEEGVKAEVLCQYYSDLRSKLIKKRLEEVLGEDILSLPTWSTKEYANYCNTTPPSDREDFLVLDDSLFDEIFDGEIISTKDIKGLPRIEYHLIENPEDRADKVLSLVAESIESIVKKEVEGQKEGADLLISFPLGMLVWGKLTKGKPNRDGSFIGTGYYEANNGITLDEESLKKNNIVIFLDIDEDCGELLYTDTSANVCHSYLINRAEPIYDFVTKFPMLYADGTKAYYSDLHYRDVDRSSYQSTCPAEHAKEASDHWRNIVERSCEEISHVEIIPGIKANPEAFDAALNQGGQAETLSSSGR